MVVAAARIDRLVCLPSYPHCRIRPSLSAGGANFEQRFVYNDTLNRNTGRPRLKLAAELSREFSEC